MPEKKRRNTWRANTAGVLKALHRRTGMSPPNAEQIALWESRGAGPLRFQRKPKVAETAPEAPRFEPEYTLADLEAAERAAADAGPDRNTNPGSARREISRANELVWTIRSQLIKRGILAAPEPSAAALLQKRIKGAHPNPNHKDEITFEGRRYRCRYYKVADCWFHDWEPIGQ